MGVANHDNILDVLGLMQLTENVATKIHGIFNQDEIFKILSDEMKKSKKYRMTTLLLSDEEHEFKVNTNTLPDTELQIIETLIEQKAVGFTVAYTNVPCFHRAVDTGDTYPFSTIDFVKQLLSEKVNTVAKVLTEGIQKTSIISPIKIREKTIGVLVLDTPESATYADYFRLSVKNLTQHLSTALQLAEEYQTREKAELDLKNDRDRFEKIVKIVPGVIYTFKLKPDGSVSYPFSTPSMFRLFGIKPEDLEEDASPFMQLTHPDDIERVNEAIRVSAQNMTEFRAEYPYKHPQKGWRWVEAYSLPIAEPDGSIVWTGFLTDVTERKIVSQELQNERDRFEKIVETVPGVIYAFKLKPDGSMSFPFTTPNMFTLIGIKPEDVKEDASSFMQLIHPDDAENVDKAIHASAQSMTELRVEYRYKHPQKGQIWIEEHSLPIAEPDKSVVWTGLLTDVTERKLVEQQLFESNTKRGAILSTAMDGFMRIDLNGNILEVNESFCNKNGFTAKECTQMHISALDVMFTPEQVVEQIQRIVENGEVRFESKMGRKDGSSYDAELNATYHKENKDEFVVFVRDISERKKAEAELKKLSTAMEQSPASVVITDLNGNISYVNPKFEEVTGYTADNVIGENPRFLNSGHTGKDEYDELWKTITAGKTWSGVFHNKKRDGTLFWERASIGPIFNDKGEITNFLAIKEDITKLKKTEESLQNTLKSLEARVEERTAELRLAKEEIERTYNEFQASLAYAKRIQEAIIPSDTELSKVFSGVFSIYKPKDVISGDFYWCHDNGEIVILVVADCTGHGVPGALMSMSGHELLDSIVISRKITRTDMILEEMDLGMKKLIGRPDAKFTMNDGMDMSVVRIDRSGQFDYSGAQSHGLYISQNEVIPLVPDRAGIGGRGGAKAANFTRQHISSQSGDRFYLFSDGFYDQFGGPKTKKMLRKKFTEIITASSNKPIKEQGAFLQQQFKDWKGTEIQIDDVTVIGIEL